jgi:hypothetical protein
MGSPVLVNRIGFTRVSSSGAGERDILATWGDTEGFLGGGSDSRRWEWKDGTCKWKSPDWLLLSSVCCEGSIGEREGEMGDK